MASLGDVKLNGKNYRVDLKSYRDRDVVDFSPRAGTPGGSVIHSELGLYQPLMQTDWQHGFGFHWYSDAQGYLSTTGNVDTRHDGLVMMSTNSTSSDTDNNVKEGFTTWNGAVWAWGVGGLHKYKNATWEQVHFNASDLVTYTKVLQPASADAPIYSNAATSNYGRQNSLHIGEQSDAASIGRALIKFDLSEIPTTATVTSATLSLYMFEEKATNARSLYCYRQKRAWDTNSVTYNKYSTGNNWSTAGGFGADDCEQTDIGNTAFSATEAVGWKDFVLTASEVQDWLDGSFTNNGLLIKAATEDADQFRFYSSEYTTDTTLRPKLTIVYTTPAAASTGTVNFAMAAGDYLFYCPDGWRIHKVNKDDSHTPAGNDSDSRDYSWLVMHSGYIYAGVDGTNRVHRDSTSDLSDLEGTTSDPDVIYVGSVDDAFPTLGAIVFAGNLYVSRADGLWHLADDLIARKVLDFSNESSSDNFRGMAVHNGYLVFPIRDKVYQWNGARLSDVTPPRISDTFPYTTYGRFDNFIAAGKFLYCTARTNESTYNEDLLSFDGVGWHKLMRLATSTDTITAMGYDPVNNYLWYHKDATADATYYIPFQSQSEFPYAAFPTTGTHSLISSRLDMGFRRVTKSVPSLLVEASNVTSTRYLTIYYSIDGGSWTAWGDENITTDGITELTLPAGLQSVEFNYMKLRVDFVTATATESPILEGLTLRFLMRPDTWYGWSFNIPIAKGQDMGESIQERSVLNVLKDLKDARDSKSPIEFIDIFGERHLVYITSNVGQAVEWDRDEGGSSPNIEYVRTLNLAEVS